MIAETLTGDFSDVGQGRAVGAHPRAGRALPALPAARRRRHSRLATAAVAGGLFSLRGRAGIAGRRPGAARPRPRHPRGNDRAARALGLGQVDPAAAAQPAGRSRRGHGELRAVTTCAASIRSSCAGACASCPSCRRWCPATWRTTCALGPSLCGRDADVARCLELAGLGGGVRARARPSGCRWASSSA